MLLLCKRRKNMEFDKKDWKKKLKSLFLDEEYKTEDENLGMIFKTKGKHSDYIRIFYKNEVAKLSVLNLPRVEVSLKEVADALENENFEQLLWRIYFSEIFGAKVINVKIEKPKNYYLFDRGNLTITFSDEYIFFNSGKKPLKRFESSYGYTRNIFTGKNNKLTPFVENEDIIKKKENNFGNAQIVLKSVRKPFSHIDNHIFYKVNEYPVKEMLQEVKESHLKFLVNKKNIFN